MMMMVVAGYKVSHGVNIEPSIILRDGRALPVVVLPLCDTSIDGRPIVYIYIQALRTDMKRGQLDVVIVLLLLLLFYDIR